MFSTGYHRRPGRMIPGSLKLAVAVSVLAAALGAFATNGAGPGWRMIGKDSNDTRNQPFERTIGVDNVSHLMVKWRVATAGDVSATPAVVVEEGYIIDR